MDAAAPGWSRTSDPASRYPSLSVCVLDAGWVLACLKDATGPVAIHTSHALREHEHRNGIDQLGVALRRATEALVFVDVAGKDDAMS